MKQSYQLLQFKSHLTKRRRKNSTSSLMSQIRHLPGFPIINSTQTQIRIRTYRYYWCQRCLQTLRHNASMNHNINIVCPNCLNRQFVDLRSSDPASQLLGMLAAQITNNPDPDQMEENPVLTSNHRPRGPPPADLSEIEALPTVKLKRDDINISEEFDCAICKEKFGAEEDVKVMPCTHFYHVDCIVPWLRLHSSCPVCRYQLRGSEEDDDYLSDEYDYGFEFQFDDIGDCLRWLWNQLVSVWPLRQLYDEDNRQSEEANYPWWRSWLII